MNTKIFVAFSGLMTLALLAAIGIGAAYLLLAEDSVATGDNTETGAAIDTDDWFSILYDGQSQTLKLVGLTGERATVSLPALPSGQRLYNFSISPDGTRLAACDFAEQATQVYIIDILSGAILHSLPLPLRGDCNVARQTAFRDDGRYFAVGWVNAFIEDTENPNWALHIIDTETGTLSQTLDAFSPAAANIQGVERGLNMPVMRFFDANNIVFGVQPWGGGGAFQIDAYAWRYNDGDAAGTITPANNYGNWGVDTSGGELIWASNDERVPAAQPMGMGLALNTVNLADKSGQTRPIYVNSDEVIFDSDFVAQGAAVAVLLFEPAPPPSAEPPLEQPQSSVAVVGRDGSVTRYDDLGVFVQVADAPNGFIALRGLAAEVNSPNYDYILTYYNAGNVQNLLEMPTSPNGGISWELLWSKPLPRDPNLGAFATFSGS